LNQSTDTLSLRTYCGTVFKVSTATTTEQTPTPPLTARSCFF